MPLPPTTHTHHHSLLPSLSPTTHTITPTHHSPTTTYHHTHHHTPTTTHTYPPHTHPPPPTHHHPPSLKPTFCHHPASHLPQDQAEGVHVCPHKGQEGLGVDAAIQDLRSEVPLRSNDGL